MFGGRRIGVVPIAALGSAARHISVWLGRLLMETGDGLLAESGETLGAEG